VKLKKDGQIYEIRINWLTGMIDVANVPKA
jgi:hypothetical protein